MPTTCIKETISQGRDFVADAMAFSVPLCTVTTCETLPTAGTKSMLLGVKALTPPCLPLADRTQTTERVYQGMQGLQAVRSQSSPCVFITHVGACRCGSKKIAGICRCPRSKAKGKFSEVRFGGEPGAWAIVSQIQDACNFTTRFPHTVLCPLVLLSRERWETLGMTSAFCKLANLQVMPPANSLF